MPYVYHTDDGMIQGFSRERSDISLGDVCIPISVESYEMLCALPTGFRLDLSTGDLQSHMITDGGASPPARSLRRLPPRNTDDPSAPCPRPVSIVP
jgi:hypothetical protein